MNNIKVLIPSLIVVAQGAEAAKKSVPTTEQKPVNVIYIMTDDHAFQAMSCYDGQLNSTPNLDRLANEGVRFTNSFVSNSISGPSRGVMITGKHSHMNGMIDNSVTFDGSQQTYPKLLQEAGYQTAMIGKWHLGGTPTGFDFWEILPGQGSYYNPDFITAQGRTHYDGYVTDVITDMGIDWIKERNKEKPFCMLLHHKAVHRIWMSDTTHLNDYEDVTFKLPETMYDHYVGRPAAAAQKMSIDKDMDLVYDLKMLDPAINSPLKSAYGEIKRMNPKQRAKWDSLYLPLTKDFIERDLKGQELVEWKFQRYMRDYLKCVKSLDENIGRLYAYLESEGLLENTLIIYTSDQGFYMGEHGWFDKRFMYEESMRTPLLMRQPNQWRGAARGVTIPELVQNIDYAPTILECARTNIPGDLQGLSLVPLLKGEKTKQWRDALYYHYYEFPGEHEVRRHYGVRTDRYKLIHFYGDIESWEMYDLKRDPNELNNLYGTPEYAKVQQQLHTRLGELRQQYKVTED